MRIRFSTALLLITATTINAAPTPQTPTTAGALVDSITDQLKAVYDHSEATKDCGACVAALALTKTLDRHNRPGVLKALKKLCPTIEKQTTDVVKFLNPGNSVIDGQHEKNTDSQPN